ncbi:5-formyltetrahydrofolate cyclo-ligase [Candidatus Pelagibacter sp.]|nr:5-formyltetrahydrofolate cyclo-ligase [Candidatus Pelagibacter sp.]
MSKEYLRKKLLNLRKTNFNEQGINFIQFKKIFKKINLKKKINIGGYYPINSEIGCLDILEKLEKNNFKISLPVTKKKNNMDFYEWSFKDLLKVSNRGIPEPMTKKKVYPDVLIIPLVGFDKNKFRLGYGGGFYDRYISKILNKKRVITVGFAFSFQEIFKIPTNKFDQKLDIILTNKSIIK